VLSTGSAATTLGGLVRQWRKRAGLSQAALAERASLSTAAIAAIEQGQRRQPHPHTVRQLARALGLDAAEEAALLELVSPRPPTSLSAAQRWPGPTPSTELIGRERELRAVTDLLVAHPPARLVTLTGPGGVGKTRLALAVASDVQPHFADGAAFIELAALRDPRLVGPTIAHVFGIRESAASDPLDALLAVLRTKHVLLVLDNFEHLTGEASVVVSLVDACPGVSVLVTSRTALRVRAEQRYPLEPLGNPAAAESELAAIATAAAVRLFVNRARARSPAFELTADNASTIAAICRRLDGLPLAIELAAARVLELPPRALLARLERRLSVLTDGPADLPERQQTLRATLEWSYTLLPMAEQALFRQLAVFAGGWTLQAAEAVCQVDEVPLSAEAVLRLQTSLVDRSMVRPTERVADDARFEMLETLREYALERLADSGEEAAVRRRVADYYQQLAETAERGLRGIEHARWLALLANEQDNLRAVLSWALQSAEVDRGERIAGAIWHFWWMRGQLNEGRQWLDDLLAASGSTPPSAGTRAKALNAAASLALGLGDYPRARALYEQSVAAATLAGDRDRLAAALHNLGLLAAEQGDAARAVACVEASLTHARAIGSTSRVAVGLCTLGWATRQQGDLARAASLLEQSLALLRQLGDQLWEESALRHLAEVARDRHEWAAAEQRYKEALRVSQALGEGYVLGYAKNLEGLAEVAVGHDRPAHAARLLGAAARLREETGSPMTPLTQTLVERVRRAAGAALGDERFQDAVQAGARLDAVAAVELALTTSCAEPAPAVIATDLPPNDRLRSLSAASPPARARLISRQRLLDRLDAALQHGLTVVAAPAGFGKSSLLADWAGRIGPRAVVVWLNLDRGDDDPTRFWRHLLAALAGQQPELGSRALRMLGAGGQGSDMVIDELLAEFGELAADLVLILDDYHLIRSPLIHSGLSTLLNQAPRQFHLVLSSRVDPPLPLARRRAAADLVELRAADLRFSEPEAASLLHAVVGHGLTSEQVRAISDRTEGWAVGLQLAAVSVREAADSAATIARFSGDERFVVDYFVEEVLAQLSDSTRRFLLHTSVLSRLCAPLCDALLSTSGSAEILTELERAGLFLTPIDADGQWYRYHQLFAEALRHTLRREAPELEPDLHTRAIDWYVTNGLTENAIDQALAGRVWERATELMAGQLVRLIQRHEGATANRWLEAVPDEVLHRHPVLGPARAIALIQLGDFAAAVTFLTAAERALGDLELPGALGAVLSLHALVAAYREANIAQTYAEQALALLLPESLSAYRLTALNVQARVHLHVGTPGAAAQKLEQALPLMNHVTVPLASFEVHHQLGQLRMMEGRLRAASAQFEALLAITTERPFFARQQALLGLATLAYERDQLAEARDFLDRVAEAHLESGRRGNLPYALLLQARIARAQGDRPSALDALDGCEATARQFGHVRLQRLARAGRAWLAVDGYDLPTARQWADELDHDGGDVEAYAREPELLMRARIWLAEGRPDQAVLSLTNALARAEQAGRAASVIAISTQLARALLQGGDRAGAVQRLEHALALAEPEGYVRVFVDEGAPLRSVLLAFPRQHAAAGYVARVLAALDGADCQVPAGADLLTAREREVLALLAQGLSNRAIAGQLLTSEGTIKSHVHRLIAKFGVSTRAHVLVRARQQGLLG
jgi:LuxR family maltose regulon positive regulatory protein